jgi:hypothetical protein
MHLIYIVSVTSVQSVGRGPGLLALHKVENVYRDNEEKCKRKQKVT